jgi:acetyl esterase/lipase
MPTRSIFGRARRPGGLKPETRSSTSYLPRGAVCLEERLLLSGTVAGSHSALTTLTSISQGPTAPDRSVRVDQNHVYRNITYTDGDNQPEALDVYVPKGKPPAGGWPVILAIHGGGWRKQNKNDYGPRIASAFVSQGYVVVAPNYPLSSPGNPTWPVNLEDLQTAVRWIRQNAGTFSIDSSRIVAMGESAGANLANLLGTASAATGSTGASSAAVEAVVSFSSPTDMAALYASSPEAGKAAAQFLGGPPTAVPANYTAASPVEQVRPGDPPTFLIHGSNDPLVPVSQSEELAGALAAAGVPEQLVVIPGAGHDLDFPIKTPRNLVFQILEFLRTTWNDKESQSLIP